MGSPFGPLDKRYPPLSPPRKQPLAVPHRLVQSVAFQPGGWVYGKNGLPPIVVTVQYQCSLGPTNMRGKDAVRSLIAQQHLILR